MKKLKKTKKTKSPALKRLSAGAFALALAAAVSGVSGCAGVAVINPPVPASLTARAFHVNAADMQVSSSQKIGIPVELAIADAEARVTTAPETTAPETEELKAREIPETSETTKTPAERTTSTTESVPSNTGTAEPRPSVAEPAETEPPVTEPPVTEPAVTEPLPDAEVKPPYDFSAPVPLSRTVYNDDYFADALFIGDSRTVGIQLYGRVKAYYYVKVALTIRGVTTQRIIPDGEERLTIAETVKKYPHSFKKVYICFGLNECGWDMRTFRTTYEHVLETIRGVLPEGTPIYVQAVLPITSAAARKSPYGINNTKINNVNAELAAMCRDGKYYYLAVNEDFKDENGDLSAKSPDGIHMGSEGVRQWLDYLKCHVVNESLYEWGE